MARDIKSAAAFFQEEAADCGSRARAWRDLHCWTGYHQSGDDGETLRATRLRFYVYWSREAEWLSAIARRNVSALLGHRLDDDHDAYPPPPRPHNPAGRIGA